MHYEPKPLDVSGISIPEELEPLQEAIAKNVHDVWAVGRIADGWTWGPVRNDERKEHPCLVPYEELTEEEKGYDRATAMSTIKFILAMGYRVGK